MRKWLRERRERRRRAQELHDQLRQEYIDALESGDPATMEASRDYSDNDGTPWRMEVAGGLAMLVVLGVGIVVLVLIVLFAGLEAALD